MIKNYSKKKETVSKKKDSKKSFKRTKFEVKSEFREPLCDFDVLIETAHWNDERKSRHEKIKENIGEGKFISSFIVDTGHPHGDEIHTIFDNGMILIQNADTGRLVTELIARPEQVKRYWEKLGKGYPIEIYKFLSLTSFHRRKKWNQW